MQAEVIVVTSAYGHDKVRALGGQAALLPIIAASGADGVEIRRELLNRDESLPGLAEQIRACHLSCVYSSPTPLFDPTGTPDLHGLTERLDEATQLGARLLKLPLGHAPDNPGLAGLTALLRTGDIRLLIENDQTPEGGTPAPLLRFFQAVQQQGAPIGMTFDMANWHWLGEDNARAAAQLASFVEYIHVKASRERDGKVHAVSLDEAPDTWAPLIPLLPTTVPRGIESPLLGDDLAAVTRGYVNRLRIPAA
ncbi:xylose isomerase [Zobellella endophytica]|uniref:Xylose isomerase n=1 Tax=Zobellella endophytica TaxID=2116700 RepID=A0A2P7R4W9_9GAMM|nr:TIM barrel protein [Zobellella endophytica]PSJ45264.1 xylose isomerase [Zobellella endophytica]